MTTSRIRLITRGDDIGMLKSVNDGAIHTFQNGILRNVSVLATGPAVDEFAAMHRSLPGLCVGLHATVTAEWDWPRWRPILPRQRVPLLVDADGTLPASAQTVHQRQAPLDQIMDEITAQYERLKSAGLPVAYIDTHMGFGWLCEHKVDAAVAEFAASKGLVCNHTLKLERLPKAEGNFASMSDRLIAQLSAAGPGTYLWVIHPGLDTPEMRPIRIQGSDASTAGKVCATRSAEVAMFSDPKVIAFCRDNGVELMRYSDV